MQIGNTPAALAALGTSRTPEPARPATARPAGTDPVTAQPQQAETAAGATGREFEALFLTQAVDEMMKTVDLGSFGAGNAEETWRSFLARAIADEIAGKSSIGLARNVETTIAAYNRAIGEGRE